MLTKSDIDLIRRVVRDEIDSKIFPLSVQLGNIDQRFDTVDQKLGVVDQRLGVVEKKLKKMNTKLNRVAKDVSWMSREFDKEIVQTRRRVDRLEEHLRIS